MLNWAREAWWTKARSEINIFYYDYCSFWEKRELTCLHQGLQIRVGSERQTHEPGLPVLGSGESLKVLAQNYNYI